MADLDVLLDALDTIYAHRATSAVVVAIEGRKGLYAEFWADKGRDGLAAEIVGNEDLPLDEHLTPNQERELRDRGWDDVTGMWRRDWPSTPTRADRQRVAYETLRTLGEVYGATGAVRIEEVILPDAPAAQASARMAVVILAALLVLGAAIAVFVFAAPQP